MKANKDLYPSICLGTTNEDKVLVNFNQDYFEFNLQEKLNVSNKPSNKFAIRLTMKIFTKKYLQTAKTIY